jgi:hypothetical protein
MNQDLTHGAGLAAGSHRAAVKAYVQGFHTLAIYHQNMAAIHAATSRAHRFAIIDGRDYATPADYVTIG